MHVLLIDNDPNLRRVLTEMLEWMGHAVKVYASSEVEMLQSGEVPADVDVVIVHHAPPGLDVDRVRIAVHDNGSQVPVVMIADRMSGGTENESTLPEGTYQVRQPVSVGAMRQVLRRAHVAH